MSQPLGENKSEISITRLGDLVGIPLTDELVELLVLWQRLDREMQIAALALIRASVFKTEVDH